MAGGFASALMFIMVLMATIVVGLCFLTYIGRCLFVVVEETANGNDEMTWPDEPFQDWIGGVVLLVWLLVIWLAPFGLILRLTKPAIVAEYPFVGVILGALVLWVCFPVSLLSSLASVSRWNFFHWRIPTGMIRLAPWTALFYGETLLVGAIALSIWIVAVALFPIVLVPVAGFFGAVAILLYARMLGQLAQKISVLQPLRRVKPKVPPPETPPLKVELVRVNDPWASPALPRKQAADKVTPPPPVQALPQPKLAASPNVDDEWEEGGHYGVNEETARTGPTQTELYEEPPPPVEEEAEEEEPTPRRKKRKGKRKASKPEKPAPGLWLFPFYACNRRTLATLAIVGTIFGMLLQAFVAMLPS